MNGNANCINNADQEVNNNLEMSELNKKYAEQIYSKNQRFRTKGKVCSSHNWSHIFINCFIQNVLYFTDGPFKRKHLRSERSFRGRDGAV